MNYDPTNASGGASFGGAFDPAKEQSFVQRVFNWMFYGLAITGIVAFLVSTSPVILNMIYGNLLIQIILGLGTLALVWNLSANVHKMSSGAAMANFFIYAALNGVLMSYIFLVYTSSSIFSTFLITSATFGAMALYGYTTKKDLSGMGPILFMALIGLIIASVVNMFMNSSGLELIISYGGVLIFVGLTAYDMQQIKRIGNSVGYNPNLAILGALKLYLDFINLFIFLLRILGNRRR